jgi:hypothetical protein
MIKCYICNKPGATHTRAMCQGCGKDFERMSLELRRQDVKLTQFHRMKWAADRARSAVG